MTETESSSEEQTVLVIEDDRDLADTYTAWLEPEYEVRTAYSGIDGLTWYDPAVDVVLLDRRLSTLSGTDVIKRMAQRDIDDQRALLTSVGPGEELVDLPCGQYLTKPVTKTELRDVLRELKIRSELDDELQQHFTLASKIAALENSDATGAELALEDLRREAKRVRARIEDRLSELDDLGYAYKVIE